MSRGLGDGDRWSSTAPLREASNATVKAGLEGAHWTMRSLIR